MSTEKKDKRPSLAEALDATQWDFVPDPERKMLLHPVGSIFENLPWEVHPQYLGPAPIEETETEDQADGEETQRGPDGESFDR